MSSNVTLIHNIHRLVTMVPSTGQHGPLGVIEDGALRISEGKIAWLGHRADLPKAKGHEEVIDAGGGIVIPGLIDCHTHIVHGGWRHNEFNLRSQGRTYQDIAAAGGGIMSTVRATREASEDKLFNAARARIGEAISHGTTTIEIKTGYGLDAKSESKMSQVILRLGESGPARIAGTFLGAHIVPVEFRNHREKYVRLVIDEMLPEALATGAVSACDVFVEEGAFTKDEARAISAAAKDLGLGLHLHVDQFSDGGGAALAAELRTLSADHLDYASDDGMRAMANAGVVAVLLPGASFFAGRGHFPDARKMINLGVTVAIATDYNPGTNPCLDLWLAATIAITQMGLSCDEALLAITKNAAMALGLTDRGLIAAGNRADLVILDAPNEHFPLYRYGANFVRKVIIGGEIVCG